METLKRWLLDLTLLLVPRLWRDDVRRDLAEESSSILWRTRHAVAVGVRMRWTPRSDAARPHYLTALSAGLMWQDIRFAGRMLARQPGWTATAVLTLALGIGANTAVFSVVNALLLNPLPYRNAERVIIPWRSDVNDTMSMTPQLPILDAWRRDAVSLEALEVLAMRDVTLTGDGEPTVLAAAAISETFPSFAGVPLVIGRGFSAAETTPSGPAAAVLAERTWRTRFGADPAILGRSIVLDHTPHVIVGVLSDAIRFPAGLNGQARRQVFVPFVRGSGLGATSIARLKPGVTTAQAAADLDRVVATTGTAERVNGMTFKTAIGRPGDGIEFRPSLLMLSWAMTMVLIIACMNVAHLLLARGMARERELAIRATLGAGRVRLVRQLTTECLLLSAAGGAAGLGLAHWMLRALMALKPASMEVLERASIDATVIGAATAATLVTGIAFGLLTAWRAGRVNTAGVLRATSHSTHTKNRARMRSVLIVAEVAAAAVLLVGSTLLLRSVENLERIDAGFDARQLYTVSVPLPPERCSQRARNPSVEFCRALAQEWLDKARAIPEVEQATLAAAAPPQTSGFTLTPWETRQAVAAGRAMTALNFVRPEFFAVAGIRIADGTGFDEGSAARHEVVVNAGLADQLWPGQRAVGQELRPAQDADSPAGERPWFTVVGTTRDIALTALRRNQRDLAIYYASPHGGYRLLLRARNETDPTPAVRAIGLAMNPTLAPPVVTNVRRALDSTSIASARFTMQLLGVFAGVAILLCSVGLYGVIAHLVSLRTREIGIRLALGGSRAHIGRLVLGRAIGLTMAGLVLGLIASRWAASFIASSLYGVAAFDPASYIAGSTLLIVVAAIACGVPIRRAMRVDPLTATRTE